MKNELLDKGIILPSGEISKDKVNLVTGAITQPFAEMVWVTTGGDMEAKCQDKITKNYKKFLIALKTGVPLQVGSPFFAPPRRWRCKNGAKNWPAPLGVSGLVVFPCSAGQAATVMYSS